jgi:hypothetical protein
LSIRAYAHDLTHHIPNSATGISSLFDNGSTILVNVISNLPTGFSCTEKGAVLVEIIVSQVEYLHNVHFSICGDHTVEVAKVDKVRGNWIELRALITRVVIGLEENTSLEPKIYSTEHDINPL